MASITFKLKGKSSTIYYRFRNGRDLDVTKTLPFLVDAQYWSAKKQQVKESSSAHISINNQLNRFRAYLFEEFNKSKIEHVSIDLDWVHYHQQKYFHPQIEHVEFKYLVEFIDHYIQTIQPQNFNPLKTWVQKLKPVRLYEVNEAWLNNFVKYNLKRGYAKGTIGKRIKQIKQVLKYASKNNLSINRNIFDYKVPKSKSVSTYLSDTELDLIFTYKFDNNRLENVKKLFLVGCTTGLRVSDLMRFKQSQITNGFIEIESKKTRQQLLIPIDPRVKEFMLTLNPISDQKFNQYIKEMCQIVGLDTPTIGYTRNKQNKRVLGTYPKHKLITSHTMRRSFATNLYGKVPTVVIMAITGHTTEKSFLTYIKKPQRDFAEQLKRYYEKQYK